MFVICLFGIATFAIMSWLLNSETEDVGMSKSRLDKATHSKLKDDMHSRITVLKAQAAERTRKSELKKKSKEETAKLDKKKSSKKPTKEVDPDIQVLQGAGAFASAVAQVSRIGKGP